MHVLPAQVDAGSIPDADSIVRQHRVGVSKCVTTYNSHHQHPNAASE